MVLGALRKLVWVVRSGFMRGMWFASKLLRYLARHVICCRGTLHGCDHGVTILHMSKIQYCNALHHSPISNFLTQFDSLPEMLGVCKGTLPGAKGGVLACSQF